MSWPEITETPRTATIAIITRNRRDELRRAVASSISQEGDIEVLVLDDGSTDGTSEMVHNEFPSVRVVRFEDDADVAARRNDAAKLATGDVIVSIDDDAVFSSPRIVADTLRDLDDPQIAAVAIPFIDVGVRPDVQQRAPDATETWVTTIFRATAYAIRRDVQLEIGGYTPSIQQFGEEWDLSLKLVDAGYVIRLGRSDVIHHHTSTKRDYRRMDVLQRRNEWLICWIYFPFPWHLVYPVWYSINAIRIGLRAGRIANMASGIVNGIAAVVSSPARRRPISRAAFTLDQQARAQLRAGGALRLSEAQQLLGPVGPRPKPQAGGWPRRTTGLYAPLRRLRSRLIRVLGRPVRCEVCGNVLFTGIPFLWRGRLKLLGAETARVRVDWDKMNRLTFRHIEIDRCNGPE